MDKNYLAQSVEKLSQEIWEKNGLFQYKHENSQNVFTVLMPPPNVTGSLHLGHALTFSIQDSIVRWKRMLGYHTLWQPGSDHAGIATQTRVTQHLTEKGINVRNLSREEMLEQIWDWKHKYSHTIIEQLKALGSSAQWDRLRFTMDDHFSEAVTTAFNTLYEQGLIYRSKTLVNWDTELKTAISDLEIVAKEQKGTLYYIHYATDFGPLQVATTRPETLFADTALAVHPSDERYKHLIGQEASIPIIHRKIPIIADHHAQADKGSGVVKITPAHDFNDYAVGQRHNLPVINILTPHGTLCGDIPEDLKDLTIKDARVKTLEKLYAEGAMAKEEECVQSIPYGDRSHTVIQPFLTNQWFINTKPMAEKVLKVFEQEQIEFFPKRWGSIFKKWLVDIQPWCISRQIYWGHRIPVWWADESTFFVAHSQEEAQEKATKHFGKPVTLTQDTDVLDTWFSSGLWPFATLGWPQNTSELETHLPSSTLVTGFDIIFFWVARMCMMSLQLTGSIPFKHVLIHGLIRDEKGQKMSKSKGNVINPLAILEEYGADSLRLALLQSASPGQDVRLSPDLIVAMRNFCTKLWNTARYAKMNDIVLCPQPENVQHPINIWAISQVAKLSQNLHKTLEQYYVHEAVALIYKEFWHEFCAWYLEATKPLLRSNEFAQETRSVFGFALQSFLHYLHPFIPHITEAIWNSFMPESLPLALQSWPTCEQPNTHGSQIDWLKNIIANARSLQKKLRDVAYAVHSSCEEDHKTFSLLSPIINSMLPTNVAWESWSEKSRTLCVVINQSTRLYVHAPNINVEKEVADIRKNIATLEKNLNSFTHRLQTQHQAPQHALDSWKKSVETLKEKISTDQKSLEQFLNIKE